MATATISSTLYKAPTKAPEVVTVPEMKYLMIDGTGDPNNSQSFKDAMQALFSIAYTIKFGRKKAGKESGYKITPPEGLWWSDDPHAFEPDGDRSNWRWTLMLAQPGFITQHEVEKAKTEVAAKKDIPSLASVRFEKLKEGRCVQMMHVGPYSAERPTIEKLHVFAHEHGFSLAGKHHEIYLGDPRRAKPERLKTILRHPVVLN